MPSWFPNALRVKCQATGPLGEVHGSVPSWWRRLTGARVRGAGDGGFRGARDSMAEGASPSSLCYTSGACHPASVVSSVYFAACSWSPGPIQTWSKLRLKLARGQVEYILGEEEFLPLREKSVDCAPLRRL